MVKKPLIKFSILTLILLVFITGCKPSKEDYFKEFVKCNLDYGEASMNFTNEVESMLVNRSFDIYRLSECKLEQVKAYEELKKVVPCSEVEDLHNELLELYNRELDIHEEIIDRLEDKLYINDQLMQLLDITNKARKLQREIRGLTYKE